MNNWWKAGLLGAGALGLSALTGGAAAGPLATLLGGAGEGAAATTGAALGEGAATTAAATGAEAAGTAAAAAPGATAFVTQPVTGLLSGSGEMSGTLAGTDLGYGTAASNSLLASGGEAAGGTGAASGTLAGTNLGYGTGSLAGGQPMVPMVHMEAAQPTAMQQAMGYAKMGGKAASAYGTVQQGIGMGSQPLARAPQAQPIFQGQAAPIAPQGLMAPQGNQFAQMLLAQRQRGMLG